MEMAMTYALGTVASIFILAGVYLHWKRKKAESTVPMPFLNPHTRRKPRKR